MPREETSAGIHAHRTAWRATLVLAAGLTVLRLYAIFASPLQLYPDEAQYWLWSRTLAFGYASKPPMIAWLIAAATRLGGDSEAWVRLFAPLLHAGAMLAIHQAGRRLYGPLVGLLAAALWGLMPAVQLSAVFIATDAPLMLFLALALWAYAAMFEAVDSRPRRLIAIGLGAALGLAFLAKYAAVYFLIGVALHALTDKAGRRMWSGWAWAYALVPFSVLLAPNLAWLAGHHFATVAHTAEVNARLSAADLFHPGKLAEFVLGQFGVLGPIPFAVLVGGATALARRRALEPADRLLLWLALPPLAIVSIGALLSRAHAHWAAAGYVAGVVVVAAWLVRWRARGWILATLVLQGLVAAVVIVAVAAPALVDASGNGRRLARVRGWNTTAALTVGAARAEAARRLTAVVVEDRYLFNELAYYGRAYFDAPGSAPLRMRPAAQALNEAELSAPLRPGEAGRVLIAETAGTPARPRLPGDFARIQPRGDFILPVGGGRTRRLQLYVAEGYLGGVRAAPVKP